MKRALVTGGAGFLGSHIADTLSDQGYHVRIFDRRESPHLRDSQEMMMGDLLDLDELERAAADTDVVFHLGGLADLNQAHERPLEAVQQNVVGTLHALEASRRAGVNRFLFASTVYVYSRAGGFYRCSKQACESFVEEYQRQYGLPYTILRFGSLYGPRSDESNGVYRLLKQAVATGRVRHVGQPEDSREYVHVEDAARLAATVLDEAFENQHVVITGHHPMRLRDLFTMFSEILGRRLEIDYLAPEEEFAHAHYHVTPYAFSPRTGRKLTSNHFVDMGQGILQVLEELDAGNEGKAT